MTDEAWRYEYPHDHDPAAGDDGYPDGDGPSEDVLGGVIVDTDTCGRCLHPFDPTDTSWNGRARYRDTRWCRSCIDRCHESTDFAHSCAICETVPLW